MNLIARYLYAVGQYLPKDSRDDVLKELRTNIEDMLPENYTEKDVYQVLAELGSPQKLANEYNPNKRYLIGPRYFDKYLAILKLVVGICIAVTVGAALLGWIVNSPEVEPTAKLVELIVDTLAGAFYGAVQGAFWVTVIFVILERAEAKEGHLSDSEEKWTPDTLPEIPVDDGVRISSIDALLSILGTIVITGLLYFQPQLIAVYFNGNNGYTIIPLLDIARLNDYMIFIFAFAVVQLGISVWKYLAERWNMPLLTVNTLFNVLACIFVVILMRDSSLFNSEFAPTLAALTQGSEETIASWFEKGKWIFALSFIVINVWDSLARFYKYLTK